MTPPATMQDAVKEAERKARRGPVAMRQYKEDPYFPASAGTGENEFAMRQSAQQKGCEMLCDAIEELVVRTSKKLAIPAEHRARPLTFARAYLGMRR
ncbi:MAG: hypothetical protein AB1431_07235 [Pseudomonadota bacterium]